MWQDLIQGFSMSNEAAIEPFLISVGFEFQVKPTLGWPQASMIFLQFAGSCVWAP